MRSKRLELQEALKKQKLKPSTTRRQETLQNQSLSTKEPRSASINNGRREKEVVTDAVGERLNAVDLEKQSSAATKSYSAFINGRRAKEIVTDAVVGERLNAIALEKQRSLTITPRISFINGQRAKEIVTDSVEERLNVAALKKQTSSTTKSCSAINNDSWANEIVRIAVDARLNAVGLKKQRLSTTEPSSAFVNHRKESESLTDPEDERLNAVAGSNTGDEDADTLDTWTDTRDEDADILDADGDRYVQVAEDQLLSTDSDEDDNILDEDGNRYVQIAEDQWLPTDSDEDADVLDANGNRYVQIAEDQFLPADSDEDADVLDANGIGDVQIAEAQSSPTNSDEDADTLDADANDDVEIVEDQSPPTIENCSSNGQGSTSMPSDTRIPIIFDKYGRPCDVGSEEFVMDIGRMLRAHCPPAIESWKIVPNSIKENIWKAVVIRYVVPEVYKPSILAKARKSWKSWKHNLRLELDKYETVAERKINIPWRLITKREDWESFVDFCNTDEDRKRRAAGRKARENLEFLHSCGRKGIFRKIYELEKENSTGEVSRAAMFVDTHFSKNMNDPKMRLVKELVEANPDGQKDIDNDAVSLVYGRDSRGSVKGMGGGVSRTVIHASAPSLEILRKVQQENKSLRSDLHLLRTQLGVHTPNDTSTPSNQSAPRTQNRTSTPPNQSAPHTQNRTSAPSNGSAPQAPEVSDLPARSCLAPDVSHLPARSRLAPEASNLPARSRLAPEASNLPARSRLAPEASNLPARSRLAPEASNLPARSRLAPEASNLPARSRLAPEVSNLPVRSRLAPEVSNLPAPSHFAPPVSNLHSSSCFIKNFKGRTIALGSFNAADPPVEHVYSLSIKEIFDRDADLFDRDGKLGDIMIGGVINWPKACVESNLPASSCFIRNFKRRIIAFGSFNTTDSPALHVCSVIVKEIYDRDAELFDEDGKLGDIMIGGVINWPNACIMPCQP
ncbi:uncharacterized protein LOC113283742 isoform X1 [Papaver somniferum]|uniref:uncharacterized protein LOC113283742 isoform X1 n=1 Tax=Papaver somniferum TaxID=3469 RepID=UPI000E6FC375|nr:uncharacterized protein LOC113283742 isoform X1 [Papaver somniferum]XP_026388868.1 uncharacterized protein LOC113283742 isoform X1 [Papaver somniferum]XP_026388869.1 uncharacterized protein LOC113283742 isoform X1 [Papaver somniferum]XP_026388870.1 uncharacterized protein LOC113283742 isoform X1 [Papaver somniferum]XP_026388871.1 uncharacterized protein LOC113283742 isoform X1 [Papaver somniferum]